MLVSTASVLSVEMFGDQLRKALAGIGVAFAGGDYAIDIVPVDNFNPGTPFVWGGQGSSASGSGSTASATGSSTPAPTSGATPPPSTPQNDVAGVTLQIIYHYTGGNYGQIRVSVNGKTADLGVPMFRLQHLGAHGETISGADNPDEVNRILDEFPIRERLSQLFE